MSYENIHVTEGGHWIEFKINVEVLYSPCVALSVPGGKESLVSSSKSEPSESRAISPMRVPMRAESSWETAEWYSGTHTELNRLGSLINSAEYSELVVLESHFL